MQKSDRNESEDYSQTSCTSLDLDKTSAKFRKSPAKTLGRVAFTRFCDGQSDGQTNARG